MIETEADTPTLRRPARKTAARRAMRRVPSITFILVAFAAGCAENISDEPHGLYVYCDGTVDGLYYIDKLTNRTIDWFSLPCLGPEFTNETGDTGYGEINLDEWTTIRRTSITCEPCVWRNA